MTLVMFAPAQVVTGFTSIRPGRVCTTSPMLQPGIINSESFLRSFLATLALLLVVMLLAGGLGISGPVILTLAIWLSILGVLLVGVFLVVRTQRPVAGAGAIVAGLAVWLAFFWRATPGPFVWPVVFLILPA